MQDRITALLLFAHAALTLAVAIRFGFFQAAAFACAAVACLALLGAAAGPRQKESADPTPSPQAVALWLVAISAAGFFVPPLASARVAWYTSMLAVWHGALLLGGAGLFLASFRPIRASAVWGRTALCSIAAATALHLLALGASPSPTIDVFTMREDGARALLSGANPYQTRVRDPYSRGAAQFGYELGNYAYPAANLFPDAAAVWFATDVRIVSVLADLATCLVLVWVASRRLPRLWNSPAALLVSAPLLYTKGAFVTEQSWTEPLMVACLALWWGLAAQGRDRPAALAFGYFLALKQYLAFFALAFLGYALGRGRPALVAVPALVVAATALPFLLWDATSFLDYTVRWMWTESLPFRKESLSLASVTFRALGRPTPGWFALVAGVATSGVLLWRWRRRGPVLAWREDVILFGVAATAIAFLFGPQAFANYYYFLTNALVLAIVGAGLRHPRSDSSPTR